MKPMQLTATIAALTALLLAAWATGAHAAPPMVTAEADVLDRSSCEWFYQLQHGKTDVAKASTWNTQVGCGIGVNTQIDAGFARTRTATSRDDAVLFSGKTALLKREGDGLGVSVVYGWLGERQAGNSLTTSNTTLGLSFTQSFGPKWTAHANAGWMNTRGADRTATWALATEYALTEQVDWVAETYGESGTKSWVSTGLRWATSEKLSVFGAYAIQRDTPRLVLTTVGIQLGF